MTTVVKYYFFNPPLVHLSNVKSLTARKHHPQSEDGRGCRARSHRAHAGGGIALSKPREKFEARVQKRTAELIRAKKALRQDAERLSAIIATQHDIATAGDNFMAVMTLIAARAAPPQSSDFGQRP
jgi:hypothetical protein